MTPSTEVTSSFRADNRYRFHCPVVGSDESFLACRFRRYRHWRGEEIDRPECRLCMHGGKCPALAMMAREAREGRVIYYDKDGDRVHRLDREIAERIAPVRLLAYQAAGLGVSDEWIRRLTGEEPEPAGVAIPAPSTRRSRRLSTGQVPREPRPDGPVPVDLSRAVTGLEAGLNAA